MTLYIVVREVMKIKIIEKTSIDLKLVILKKFKYGIINRHAIKINLWDNIDIY